jgi:cytochrome P450
MSGRVKSSTGDPEGLVLGFMAPPYADDPYPLHNALREVAPVYRSASGMVFASSYAACSSVFRSPQFGQGVAASRLRGDGRFEGSPAFQTLSHMLPFIDPPDHSRLRRLITRAFTPRAVERMRRYLVSLSDELLDAIAGDGGGDIMSAYANHIPVAVICEMLGAPHDRRADLVRWSDDLVGAVHPTVTDADLGRADNGARAFRAFAEELIAARRADPRDDLLTALVQAEEGGDLLTIDELISTVVLFIGAGIENTKHYIGFGVACLLERPELAESVRRDPDLLAAALEEVLRLEPPVQVAVPRVVLEDTDLVGVPLQAGELVAIVVGGANRDPAAYADPARFDPARTGPPNLSLATGPHLCAGAGLARLEAQVALERFLARFPEARITVDPVPIKTEGMPTVRGYSVLPVEVRRSS